MTGSGKTPGTPRSTPNCTPSSRAETALAGTPRPQAAGSALIVCPQFRIAGTIVRTIAMTARFDHAADITLNELRAELIYPLDDAADHYFRTQHPPVS